MVTRRRIKLAVVLIFVLTGALLLGKGMYAKKVQERFVRLLGGGEYKEALAVYNSAAKDAVLNNTFKFEDNTKVIVNNDFNNLVEKYKSGNIQFDSFKTSLNYILEFNQIDEKLIKESMDSINAIEKSRQALALSQQLLNEQQYEKALESLEKVKDIDKKSYEEGILLKSDIDKAYKESIIKEIDKMIQLGRIEDVKKLLEDKKNMFETQYLETKKQQLMDAADQRAVSDYDSKTEFLIWVNLKSQLTTIYEGQKGSWKLVKRYMCSSGVAGDETPEGDFTVTDRGAWFYTPRFSQGAKYWVRFYKTYLFHSLPMDEGKNIVDTTLGTPASHGCVRLNVDEAKWIYDNIPSGTRVIVN